MDAAATLTPRSDRAFFLFNALISSAAVAFIAFILLRDRTAAGDPDLAFMPAVNAVCNGLSALCLVVGYVAIRRRAVHVHRVCMVSAFILSAVFLVGYLAYHFVHGDTTFTGHGAPSGGVLLHLDHPPSPTPDATGV